MINRKKIKQEIELVSSLKMLTQAYEEISVMKMQKIRGSVLKTRDFVGKLSRVFVDVKSSYRKQIRQLSGFSTFNKNGRTVSVLLSANTKLYGDIITRTFKLFEEAVVADGSDVIIIGKLGKELYDNSRVKKEPLYFEIPDMDLAVEDLKPIVFQLANYEKVNVYYGRFENIIRQDPVVTDVSGNEDLQKSLESQEAGQDHFLFEPELQRILGFFETQFFSSYFQQTVYEGQLARFASRITAMEKALNNIEERSKKLTAQERRAKRLVEDRKQLAMMTGIGFWGK